MLYLAEFERRIFDPKAEKWILVKYLYLLTIILLYIL
jgi:hypothetical protein